MEALFMIAINLVIGAALWGLGMLLRKPVHRKGPKADTEVQISTYGAPIPILYGQCKTAMQLIWALKLHEHSHTQNVGKGGGSVTTYTFDTSWAGFFGAAPDPDVFGAKKLVKLWIDEKLAFNATADADKVTQAAIMKKFKFYDGSVRQLPDPTMQAAEGAANVPAYRGKCYGVFRDLEVTPYGNRIPTIRALTAPATVTTPALNDVQDFQAQDGGLIYSIGMVIHPDGIHIVTGFADPLLGPDYTWQLVNTYSRKVITSKKYSAPDPNCTGVTDCPSPTSCSPFGNYNEFDIDENGYIYAVSCEERGYICKLDSQTFTVQETSSHFAMSQDFLSGIFIRVSKNPFNPYLWLTNEPVGVGVDWGVSLFDRETLESPLGETDFGHFFPAPATTNYAMAISQVHPHDGSVFALTIGTGDTIYLSRLYPDGKREDFDITASLPTFNNIGLRLIYDHETDQLIFPYQDTGNNYQLAFFDATNQSLNGVTSGINLQMAESHMNAVAGVVNGCIYWTDFSSGNILQIDVLTREVTDEWDVLNDQYLGGLLYIPYKNSIFVEVDDENHYLQEMTIGRLTAGTALLGDIVSDLCKRAGLTDDDINVAQLTDEVLGYTANEVDSTRRAIEPLMESFIFEASEIDGVIEYVKRGGSSVLTVPESDLGAFASGGTRPATFQITEPNEKDLPRRVEVFYPDPDRSHEQGVQHYDRQLTDATRIKEIHTPVLMNKDFAKRLAHMNFRYEWTSRAVEFSLGPKYAKLRPTDVMTVTTSEGSFRVLLMEGKSEGLRTNWRGIIEAMEYTSDVTGEALPMPDEQVDFPGPSIYHLMDLPPLLESHNQAGLYMASGAMFDAWKGCSLYVSKDNGQTWLALQDITNRATTGVSLEALPDFSYNRLDYTSSLQVRWDHDGDVLAAKTTGEFWNGQAHYLLVGDEIISAKDVSTDDDGNQTFGPPLMRGCGGTEWAKNGHAAGERVVVLDINTIYFPILDTSYLNQSYLYNGISHGGQWEEGRKKLFTTQLHTLKPWAGVQAEGARDGSDNLTITWRRRDRFGHLNPLRAGIEVPMSETAEDYEVDILDGATVVRTIDNLTNESASYTAAEQTSDGLTPGNDVTCRIYQISAAVGRGWPLEATV